MIKDAASLLNRYIHIKPYYIDFVVGNNSGELARRGISIDKLKTALHSNYLHPYVHNVASDQVVEFYIAGAVCKANIQSIDSPLSVDSTSYINKVIDFGQDYYKVVGQYLGRTNDNVARIHYVCKDIDMPYGKKHIFTNRHQPIEFVEDDSQFLELVKRVGRR